MLQITAQLPLKAKLFSPPPKKPSTRDREYLRTNEIKAMIRAAKKVGRHGVRDGAIILLMFRHGLRTTELVALKWTQIDLAGGYIEVHRVKHGHDSIHPLRSLELRALRQIQRDYADTSYVFVSERKAPLSTSLKVLRETTGKITCSIIPFGSAIDTSAIRYSKPVLPETFLNSSINS